MTNKNTDLQTLHMKFAELVNSSNSVALFAEQVFRLFVEPHRSLGESLVLFDTHRGIISYPYVRIETDQKPLAESINSVNTPLRHVLQEKRAFTITAQEYLKYCQDKSAVGAIPLIWVGFPIFKKDDLFAAIILYGHSENSVKLIENILIPLEASLEALAVYLEIRMKLDLLEVSEQKFRRFVETSIDITFQITRGGYIDFVSSNVTDLFGCDPQGLIGKHFKVTTPMNQVSKVIDALKLISQGKTIRNMSISQKVANGDIVPMEVSASPMIKNGEVLGAQGTMRDITERHQAQQEIERLAFFPLVNPMPVVEVDLYGVPSYINPAGIQLLDRMNLDMAQVNQILPNKFKQDIRAALSDNTPIPSREVSLEGLHLLWSGFFLSNQNLLHYYATDITNLKLTENELITAKELAVQNEQVKTLFLANMSHEIRTPLNSILGFTELIEAEVKDKLDDELQAYFEIIHVSGKRLWQTVHEILDISQIETGTFDLKIETVDLAKVLRDLSEGFRARAEEKNLGLLVNVPPHEIEIPADAYCATQALSNLIDNAIKYTNDGYVKVHTQVTEEVVRVIIKDTGIGMSKEYQERMFNAFSQESTGYTKRFQGVGLGLALAQRYLDMIKAEIALESEQDVGSTFTITFKKDAVQADNSASAQTESADESSEEPVAVEEHPERLTILVVEDDPNSQKLAGFTLKKDFDLYFAESVSEAKQQLKNHKIHLILLDLSLKGDEDGLDLARFMRADDSWNDVPIIALTAHAFTSDRDRCLEAGCNEFMTKPFRRLELLEMIKKLVV